jgi:hypothetical protein
MLGDRVELKGWPHYAGGLDTKSMLLHVQQPCAFVPWVLLGRHRSSSDAVAIADDTKGKQSIYTTHRGMQVMFHVSTLLP